jgi:AbrB family looped-hinge helix DNA binding protein
MKITSKGQVTIPQAVREKAGLHPHSEVEFEVREKKAAGSARKTKAVAKSS